MLTKLTFTDYINNTTTTQTIDYDAIGNPLTYRGATLSWYGRQLTQFVKNGVTSKFTYDTDGLRSTKTVNGSKTEYQYVGDKLFYEKRGDGNSFYYFYDSYGKLSAIYHYVNGTRVPYHVVTNAQGDVMVLYNWTGTKVAEYSYDAWGAVEFIVPFGIDPAVTTVLATVSPFTYRGYCYDFDMGMYYLQSRYYDPVICRFINADSTDYLGATGTLLSYNLFAYCENDPVDYIDPSGTTLYIATDNFIHKNIVLNLLKKISSDSISVDKNGKVFYKSQVIKYSYGTGLLRALITCGKVISISSNQNLPSQALPENYAKSYLTTKNGVVVKYGLGSNTLVNININDTAVTKNTPLYIILAHELIHAYRNARGMNIHHKIMSLSFSCQMIECFVVGLKPILIDIIQMSR